MPIKGLSAKPLIDIMPVVTNISFVEKYNEDFEAIGYECMGEFGIEGRRYFPNSHYWSTASTEQAKSVD